MCIRDSHFISDLSFENPHAPGHIQGITEKPKLDLNIDISIARLKEFTFAVTQKIIAKTVTKAKTNDGKEADTNLFVVELDYTGVFLLDSKLSDEELDKELVINCNTVLFPFTRRVISDVTRDGGFPPLMLENISFNKIYETRKASKKEKVKSN